MKYTDIIGDIVRLKNYLNKEIEGFNCVICLSKDGVGIAITSRGQYDHREICHVLDAIATDRVRKIKANYPMFYMRYVKSSYSRFL